MRPHKFYKGYTYGVVTGGTITRYLEFVGVLDDRSSDRLFLFKLAEWTEGCGLCKYYGVKVLVHMPYRLNDDPAPAAEVSFQLYATHFGDSVETLEPQGIKREWQVS